MNLPWRLVITASAFRSMAKCCEATDCSSFKRLYNSVTVMEPDSFKRSIMDWRSGWFMARITWAAFLVFALLISDSLLKSVLEVECVSIVAEFGIADTVCVNRSTKVLNKFNAFIIEIRYENEN